MSRANPAGSHPEQGEPAASVRARCVLVTGVSRGLGARFARTVAGDGKDAKVIGVDVLPPRHDLGRATFVRADIANPVIARVIGEHEVDTVVHMALVATPGACGSRSSMKEMNVIGTMQLLAACQKAAGVKRLVVQSSISVYGASWLDPARFTEEMTPKGSPRTGLGQDTIEIETYVRGLARRRPDIAVTVLRLANLIGAGVDTDVVRLLSSPVVPRIMGFDPRMQFLHPDDAVTALQLATSKPLAGTYNVGAPDVLTLSQTLRMLGRPWVPVPRELAPLIAGIFRQARVMDFSADQLDALTYGWAMDTRRFAEAFGFEPVWTSRQAVAELARSLRPGLLAADRVEKLFASFSGAADGAGSRASNRG